MMKEAIMSDEPSDNGSSAAVFVDGAFADAGVFERQQVVRPMAEGAGATITGLEGSYVIMVSQPEAVRNLWRLARSRKSRWEREMSARDCSGGVARHRQSDRCRP
jgi:hypothetical protein